MSAKRISQREARRLQKEVIRLKEVHAERMSRFHMGYPGGFHLLTYTVEGEYKGRLYAAALVGCALVAKIDGASLHLYAIPEGAA